MVYGQESVVQKDNLNNLFERNLTSRELCYLSSTAFNLTHLKATDVTNAGLFLINYLFIYLFSIFHASLSCFIFHSD